MVLAATCDLSGEHQPAAPSVVSLNCHYFGNTPMIVPPMSPRQLCLPHRRRPVPMARWIPAFAGKTRIVTVFADGYVTLFLGYYTSVSPDPNVLRRSGTFSLKVMKDTDSGALDRALRGDQQFARRCAMKPPCRH